MKYLIILFVGIWVTSSAQKLRDRLQGDWVCVGILDTRGQPTVGKFGASNEYLRFSFKKSKLTIDEAPFDNGFAMDVTIVDEKIIDLLPGAVYEMPERIYEVGINTADLLTLTTKGQNGEPINYRFLNQRLFATGTVNTVIDLGVLIVQHLRLSKKDAKSINRVHEYRIPNDTVYLSPSPTFKYPQGGTFGQLFSSNIKLLKDFKLDEPTGEMIVEFDVTADGASGIKIVQGIGTELDIEVGRVMEKLGKYWNPVVKDGQEIKTTSRIHLYFYMTIAELQAPRG